MFDAETHTEFEAPAAISSPIPICDPPQEPGGEGVQKGIDTQSSPDPFASPLIGLILETWRMRQDMVRAQGKLTLQAKAICRRSVEGGDKIEADKLYRAIVKGDDHPMAEMASFSVMVLREASEPLEMARKGFEKTLTKLGAQLPIAHMAEQIRGINTLTLATIVGELGDLSVYEKGVAGIWKRAGLAVIAGERQRKKTDPNEALLHGYSPSPPQRVLEHRRVTLQVAGERRDGRPVPQALR